MRGWVAVGISIAFDVLPAFALDPERSIHQLQHTAWTLKDGAPTQVTALAQTSDGYLWIGSSLGLFRFDGIEFERYAPPVGGRLPSHNIYALAATSDGGLWVSFRPSGMAFIKEGRFTSYTAPEDLPNGTEVYVLAQDDDGRLWAGTQGGLAFHDAAGWHDVDSSWNIPRDRVWSLFADRRGTFWVGTETTLYSLAPGSRSFVRVQDDCKYIGSVARAMDGRMWLTESWAPDPLRPVGVARGSERFVPSNTSAYHVIIDRDDCMWVIAGPDGVVRVRGHASIGRAGSQGSTPSIESINRAGGLSGHRALILLEDREGSIWVGTSGGIDRFRHNSLVPVPVSLGHQSMTLLPGDSGMVWVGCATRRPFVRIKGDEIAENVTPRLVASVYRDSAGVAWWAGLGGLWRQEGFGTVFYPILPELNRWIWEVFPGSTPGLLWLSVDEHALVPVENGKVVQRAPPAGLPADGPGASFPAPDGRVWLGYTNRVCVLEGERVTTYSGADGIDVGRVRVIRGRGAHLWIGGELGLLVFRAGRFWTVAGENGAPFGTVSGIVETRTGDLWLNELLGIVHIPREEVDRLLVDPQHRIRHRRFDHRDGMPGGGQMNWNCATAIEATDGRLWFATDNGLVYVDPATVTTMAVPPVLVHSIVTDSTTYSAAPGLSLPRGTTSLRINYAAMTLAEPERVRFRYRLEGLDREWHDAGHARTASFTRLQPGDYRFQVIGTNADGNWGPPGASLGFSIMPQFHQTSWFMVLIAMVIAAIVWSIYLWRIRQVTTRIRKLHEERIGERMRIAHELHDTLLQGFLSASMQLHVTADTVPRGSPTRAGLEGIIALMQKVTGEARNAVRGLRLSDTEGLADLEGAFSQTARELSGPSGARFRVSVHGRPRRLRPLLRDEIYRVGRESLANAFRHSLAGLIEVEVRYLRTEMGVIVRDDGRGIDPGVLHDGREGHWGLAGMRERAVRMGGQLSIRTPPGGGTEITLGVPGRIAYADATPIGRFHRLTAWLGARTRPGRGHDGET